MLRTISTALVFLLPVTASSTPVSEKEVSLKIRASLGAALPHSFFL